MRHNGGHGDNTWIWRHYEARGTKRPRASGDSVTAIRKSVRHLRKTTGRKRWQRSLDNWTGQVSCPPRMYVIVDNTLAGGRDDTASSHISAGLCSRDVNILICWVFSVSVREQLSIKSMSSQYELFSYVIISTYKSWVSKTRDLKM